MLTTQRLLVGAVLVLCCSQVGNSSATITNPVANGQFFSNANMATDGPRSMGETVRVRLKKGAVIGGDSGDIVGPPMGTTWSHNFAAPEGGWSLGTWKCYVWSNAGGTGGDDDNHEYTIVAP